MSDPNANKLYNLQEAAGEFGEISPWSLRKHIYEGNIRCVRLGRRVLISAAEIVRIQREDLPSLTPRKTVGDSADHAASPLAKPSSPPSGPAERCKRGTAE